MRAGVVAVAVVGKVDEKEVVEEEDQTCLAGWRLVLVWMVGLGAREGQAAAIAKALERRVRTKLREEHPPP